MHRGVQLTAFLKVKLSKPKTNRAGVGPWDAPGSPSCLEEKGQGVRKYQVWQRNGVVPRGAYN